MAKRFQAKTGQTVLTGGDVYYKSRVSNAYNLYSTEICSFGYNEIDEMVRFPTIAHSMSIVKSLYATRDKYVTGPKANIIKFLEWNLNLFWDKFINDCMVAQEYGNQPFFKEWDMKDGQWYIKNLIPLKPHTTVPLADANGQFAGLEQQFHSGEKQIIKYIPPEQSFLYSYDMKWNDLLGRSRLLAARFPYVVYKYIIEMANIFYANFADPIKVAKAPSGRAPGGSSKTNLEIMNEKVQALDAAGSKIISMGSETDEKGNPRWSLELLESQRDAATYKDYLQFLKTEITEGVLVPALAGQTGERGSYNLWEGQAASLAYKSDLDMSQLAYMIEHYILNPLILYNFSEADIGQYKLNFTKASKENRDMVQQMVLAAMQNSRAKPDWEQISRVSGFKITEDTEAVAAQMLAAKAKPAPVAAKQLSLFPAAHVHLEKRPLLPTERKVEFEKINSVYDSSAGILKKMQLIVDKIRGKVLMKGRGIIDNADVKTLVGYGLDNKSAFVNAFINELDPVFMESFGIAKNELGFTKNPTENVLAGARMKARNIADSLLGEMEKRVQGIFLSGINNKTPFEIVSQQINDYFSAYENNLKVGVEIGIQQYVDDARRDAANDPSVELATWSAILDDVTCPFCAELDGKTVRVDSPEYTEFTPGNLHPYDRCVWVYTKNTEADQPEVNWVRPSDEMVDKYMRI